MTGFPPRRSGAAAQFHGDEESVHIHVKYAGSPHFPQCISGAAGGLLPAL